MLTHHKAMAKDRTEMVHMYIVYATHIDRDQFLGIAAGKRVDIEAYFDKDKAYGLRLEPAKIIQVHDGYANRRAQLLAEKEILEKKLKELDAKIKNET